MGGTAQKTLSSVEAISQIPFGPDEFKNSATQRNHYQKQPAELKQRVFLRVCWWPTGDEACNSCYTPKHIFYSGQKTNIWAAFPSCTASGKPVTGTAGVVLGPETSHFTTTVQIAPSQLETVIKYS